MIEPNGFVGLSSLKKLSLCTNRLNRINNGTFKSLSKLEELSLTDCQIEVIEPRAFENLKSLKILKFRCNKLEILDRTCLSHLNSIEIIDLNNNCFLTNMYSYIKRELILEGFKLDGSSDDISEVNFKVDKVLYPIKSNFDDFLSQFSNFSSTMRSNDDCENCDDDDVVSVIDPFIGLTFKAYLIMQLLGRGAFGQVYLVNDQQNNQL